MVVKPTQSRERGQGGTSSLFVCPLWGLGQRPNCFSGAQFKETAHKGAGSEASLPVTSRFLRSAPKLLFRLLMLCRARWARPNGWSFKHSCFFLKAGNFASAEAAKGHENRRMSAVALWKPSGRTHVYWLLPGQNQTNQHISVLKQKSSGKRQGFLSAFFKFLSDTALRGASGRWKPS